MGDMHHLKKNVRFLKKILSIDFTFPLSARLAFCGLLLSLIFLLPALNAQIKIEERVEIAPESYNYETDDPILNHIIQLDVQWNQPQYNAGIAGIVVPCQSAGANWQNGGTISLTINNAMAGFYRLQPRFNTPSGVMTHVTYQLFLDGTQVLSGQIDLPGGFSGGSFPYFNIDYTPPLASSFYFNLQNNTSCILIPTPIAISASASCATGYSWYINTEPLNLTFTSGGEYASFYTNGQKIGDSYSGTLSEIQHINVIQDKVYRGSVDMYYEVQGDWAGVIKKDSVRLISQIDDVIVADTEGEDSIYSGQQIQVMIYPNDFGGQCSGIFFPYEVTYNVEIISGNQFGNLIDYFPERRVQILTGLSHWYGMSAFNYIADGISADSLETVTIRVSTSDPEIPSTDLTLYIKPSPIYAYTVPEVLGADEEADVIIKKRNPDGTLEDFPPNQTFELAVLDGCVNGNFMVNGVIDVYFAAAQQPIKFVTADSIDTEFDKVLMRIGTDLNGGYRPIGGENGEEEKKRAEYESRKIGANGKTIKELREGFEKMIAEKKAEAEADTKEGGAPMFPVVSACAPNNPFYLTYYEWSTVVGGCSPLCNGEPPETNILTTRLFNIYFDPCEDRDKNPTTLELGGFTPVKGKDKWRSPSYFYPCFDGVEQVWRFSMNDIQLNVTVDYCQNFLNKYQVISNISEVDSNKVCDAVKDFKKHEFYPLGVRNGGYMIMGLLEKHEEIHERVYLEYMSRNKGDFDRILSEFKPTCEQYPNNILAYAGALEKLDPLINSYFTINYDLWKKEKGWEPFNKVKREEDENKTQSHPEVQAIWKNYIKSLEVLYPSKYKKCK